MAKSFYYGGQAVMEGVMMRGKTSVAVAVRREDGSISTVTDPLDPLYTGKLRETPIARGIIALIEALVLGVKSILISAKEFAGPSEKVPGAFFWGAMVIGLAVAVGLFFVLPLVVMQFFDRYLASSFLSNLLEGVLRLGLFVAYLSLISMMPDIRRVFAYHGAEHKVINAFEAGAVLDVSEVRRYSTAHVRCGTSFILVVMLLAIVVFALVGRPSMAFRLGSRIVLIPLIAAVGYELIRFSAGHAGNKLVRLLLTPGLALQTLTTRQPDDSQIEVSLAAFKSVLAEDGARSAAAGLEPQRSPVQSPG